MARGAPKEVMEMLHAVPLLAGCNKKELRQIANLGTRVSVADGTVLTEQGRPGREFFLLMGGEARCLVNGALVANFSAGDFFGEMALLDRGPRHATVTAEGQADLLVLDGAEFNRLLDTSPSIAKKLLFALAERERANATVRS
jgi:CRP/FNR family transcriptional regulator, cyclic AMP receptor protein